MSKVKVDVFGTAALVLLVTFLVAAGAGWLISELFSVVTDALDSVAVTGE